MKKIISIIILMMLVVLASCNNKPNNNTSDITKIISNDLYDSYILYDDSLVLTKYKGNESNIEIPEYIEGHLVTGISSYCFNEDLIINNISITKYIKSFDSLSHYGKRFNNIEVAEENKYYYVDNNCLMSKAKKVVIGSSNGYIPSDSTAILDYAYYDTEEIDVILPNNIEYLGSYAFGSNTKSITLNDGINKLMNNALAKLNIESINIPESLENIAYDSLPKTIINITVDKNNQTYVIKGNALVKSKTNELVIGFKSSIIDSTIKTIGQYAFYNVKGLISIVIPSNVTKILDYAFLDCSDLNKVTLPDEINTFGIGVFQGTNLELVTLPYGITKIEETDFLNCNNLKYVVIPYSVKSMNNPFKGCNNLEIIFLKASKINYTLSGDLSIYNNVNIKYYTDNIDDVNNNSNLWTYYNNHIYTKDLSI